MFGIVLNIAAEKNASYTVSQKKKQSKLFSHNFVKCLLNLISFGTKMAKTMKSCNVHSLSTSPNLCQCTTV